MRTLDRRGRTNKKNQILPLVEAEYERQQNKHDLVSPEAKENDGRWPKFKRERATQSCDEVFSRRCDLRGALVGVQKAEISGRMTHNWVILEPSRVWIEYPVEIRVSDAITTKSFPETAKAVLHDETGENIDDWVRQWWENQYVCYKR